jgi:hypothetical protein
MQPTLWPARLLVLSEKSKAAFEKLCQRTQERQQIFKQTGMPGEITGAGRLADHPAAPRSTPED